MSEKNAKPFENSEQFYDWLKINHNTHDELWMKIYKKSTLIASIDWQEAVRVALCWGWIDGIKKSLDDEAYLQRFTPRRSKSIWSKRNTKHVEDLIKLGLMTDAGMQHVKTAKADGRWDAAYAINESTIPQDFIDAIATKPDAKIFYEKLSKSHLAIIAYALGSAKKTETRQRHFNKYLSMLENQQKPQ